jgi:hypothetical protein
VCAQALVAAAPTERTKYDKARQAVEEDNARFVENSQQQQQLLIQRQDQDLTELESTLTRLGEIGVAIGSEAELHNQLRGAAHARAARVPYAGDACKARTHRAPSTRGDGQDHRSHQGRGASQVAPGIHHAQR